MSALDPNSLPVAQAGSTGGTQTVSQDEIDAILLGIGSLDSGPLPDQADAQTFDLQALPHVRRGPLPGLDVVNLRFARYLHSGLMAWLGREVHVLPAPVQQLPFIAALANLPTNKQCFTLQWSGELPVGTQNRQQSRSLRLEALLVVEPALAFSAIDLALGGSAQIQAFNLAQAPSPVGQRLLRQLAATAAQAGAQAWAGLLGQQCKVELVEPTGQPMHIATDNERVVASPIQIKLGDQAGGLTFFYPWFTLEPLAAALRNPSAGDFVNPLTKANANWAAQLVKRLNDVHLPLAARWQCQSTTLAQVAQLNVGDFISLDGTPVLHAQKDPVQDGAGDEALLTGILRNVHGQTALQVERLQ